MIKSCLSRLYKPVVALWLSALVASVSAPVSAATTTPPAPSGPDSLSWMCKQLDEPVIYSDKGAKYLKKGKGGFVFRSQTDFVILPALNPTDAGYFAHLNRQLAKSKVQLVVFIAPPRGVTMRDNLDPVVTAPFHFNPDAAKASYATTQARLRQMGIVVPDVFSTLAAHQLHLDGVENQYYLSGDPHWTAFGAYLTAHVIAEELAKRPTFGELSQKTFTTTAGAPRIFTQGLFAEGHEICKVPYTPEMRRTWSTTADASDSGGLLGDEGVGVALMGTSFSTIVTANFSGFLAQELHTDVANYGVTGGGFESSILSYLLSDDFAQSKPKFLIWEMQYHNLKDDENFPLIVGASDGDCGKQALVSGKPVPIKLGQTPLMTLGGGERSRLGGNVNLVLDLATADPRQYHMYINYMDGQSTRFDIDASRWTHSANKMIARVPRDGKDIASVSMVPDQRLSGTASAHFCKAAS